MNFLLTGGTGFVGKRLVQKLVAKGHHIFILTRTPEKFSNTDNTTYIEFDHVNDLPPIHVVVNLAGESLFGYWTKEKKRKIESSRIEVTKKIVDIMAKMEKKPSVFISGSAVGFYGMADDLIFTEETEKPGNDFLADVVVKWEKTAQKAEKFAIRTVYARFGVILEKDGGSLPLMALPTKLFAGGRVGKGEQWTSWVHLDDAVNMIIFALENENVAGALNVTAPNPMRNKEFNRMLAKVLHRPYWFPTPAPLMRIATGEMSQLVLKGQFVLPNKALAQGYQFQYPDLEAALKAIFSDTKM